MDGVILMAFIHGFLQVYGTRKMDGVILMVLIHDDNQDKCLFVCPWWSLAMVKLNERCGFENSMKKWETKTIRDAPC